MCVLIATHPSLANHCKTRKKINNKLNESCILKPPQDEAPLQEAMDNHLRMPILKACWITWITQQPLVTTNTTGIGINRNVLILKRYSFYAHLPYEFVKWRLLITWTCMYYLTKIWVVNPYYLWAILLIAVKQKKPQNSLFWPSSGNFYSKFVSSFIDKLLKSIGKLKWFQVALSTTKKLCIQMHSQIQIQAHTLSHSCIYN